MADIIAKSQVYAHSVISHSHEKMLKTFCQILLFIFMLMPAQKIISQQADHEPSSKARRAFNTALDHWNEKRVLKAEKELRAVIELDSLYLHPLSLLSISETRISQNGKQVY